MMGKCLLPDFDHLVAYEAVGDVHSSVSSSIWGGWFVYIRSGAAKKARNKNVYVRFRSKCLLS